MNQIIHWGIPSTLEQYVQEIGHASRDGCLSHPLLILGRLGQYTKASTKKYLDNKDKCRRVELFKNFITFDKDCATDKKYYNLCVYI